MAARRAKDEADDSDPKPATSTHAAPERPGRTSTDDSDPHAKATKAAERGEKATTAHPLAKRREETANTETPQPAAGGAGHERAPRPQDRQRDPAHRWTAGQQSAAQQATRGAGDTDRSDHTGHASAAHQPTASRQHGAASRASRARAASRRGENRAPTTGRGERDKSHGVPPREPER